MKKGLILLVVVVVVAVVAWLVSKRYGLANGDKLVPAETVAYIALPDLARTAERWPETALAKILEDEQLSSLLEKPLGAVAGDGAAEAQQILENLKPGRIFFAVESISEGSVPLLLGFQYFGGNRDLGNAMDRLHQEVMKTSPGAEKTTTDYEGRTITAIKTEAATLFTASFESWGFLSNNDAAIRRALDRAAGRLKEPTLADNDTYKLVMGKVSEKPDLAVYVNTTPVVDWIGSQVAEADAAEMEDQLAEMHQLKAVGGSLEFDGLDQREKWFFYTPNARELPKLQGGLLSLTTPETIVFLEGAQDWEPIRDPDYVKSLPDEVQLLLQQNEIDLVKVSEMFGGDAAVVVSSWPQDSMAPSAFAVMEIKDRAGVESLISKLSTALELNLQPTAKVGATIFPLPEFEFFDPVFAVTDKALYLALTSSGADQVISRPADAPTLKEAPAFAKIRESLESNDISFGYIDSKTIFDRVYPQVRDSLGFVAMVNPDFFGSGGTPKLPEPEAISQYLHPIVFSMEQTSDGLSAESSGPVTLYQSLGTIGLVAGGFWAAQAFGLQ